MMSCCGLLAKWEYAAGFRSNVVKGRVKKEMMKRFANLAVNLPFLSSAGVM